MDILADPPSHKELSQEDKLELQSPRMLLLKHLTSLRNPSQIHRIITLDRPLPHLHHRIRHQHPQTQICPHETFRQRSVPDPTDHLDLKIRHKLHR